jgi:hypothetical protein
MDEDILIPIIVFSFVLSLIWMILSYSKWRFQQKQEMQRAAGASLGTSELKALMREAVEEASAPLAERLEALEAEVRQASKPRLMPAQKDPLLDDVRATREEASEPAARRVT